MSQSLLLTHNGWNPTFDGRACQAYNNDSGIWSSIANSSEGNNSVGANTTRAHKGGWDGNRWYSISPTGGLYAYTPTTDTWAGPLVSGTVVIGGTPSVQQWCMASDGAYIYILSDSNDFRRYDPGLDAITALATPPGSAYAATMFLVYDGSGSIYGSKGGGAPALISKYDIGSNTWSATASGDWSSLLGVGQGAWPAYLQGSLWLVLSDSGATLRAYQYPASGGTWVTRGTTTSTTLRAASPGGEDSDSSIRVWEDAANASHIYNVASDSWTLGANSPVAFGEGTNYAVTRTFSAAFTWYLADGVTLVPITIDLGSAVLGQQLTYHARVKTPVGRAAGVTVSVPVNTGTDAEDPVRICQTVSGVYATSFVTGALNAGDEFDVFLSFSPTAQQTMGLAKRFFLKIA